MPSDFDLAWAKDLIRAIKDGGIWALPGPPPMATRLHKQAKVLELVAGPPDHATMQRTRKVFELLGWSFLDSTKPSKN
jgi:hypothetical protein